MYSQFFPLLLILCFYIYPIYSVWILSSLKAEIHCFVSYCIQYSGSQLLGRYPWGVGRSFYRGCISDIYILQLITVAKLQLWSSKEIMLWLSVNMRNCVKGNHQEGCEALMGSIVSLDQHWRWGAVCPQCHSHWWVPCAPEDSSIPMWTALDKLRTKLKLHGRDQWDEPVHKGSWHQASSGLAHLEKGRTGSPKLSCDLHMHDTACMLPSPHSINNEYNKRNNVGRGLSGGGRIGVERSVSRVCRIRIEMVKE